MGEGIRKSSEKQPAIWIGPDKMSSAVQGHDGFSSAGRPRHPGRSGIVAFDQVALFRGQEDCPFLPGKVERSFQLVNIGHHTETPLCVGVFERARKLLWRRCGSWLAT